MKEIKINVDNYNENSIKTIEGDNLSEVYKIYICKNKRRIDLTNKIAIMAYVNEYGNKKSNILALNITNASQGEIELPITNVISSENGVYACQIAIYGENNSLEQTAPFSLIVENNIFSKISNTAINSTDFHILSEAIKTTSEYAEKLKQGTESIELQYANKLNIINLELERKANKNEVRNKSEKINPNDFSENALALITGNGEITIESTPSDDSVNYNKIDKKLANEITLVKEITSRNLIDSSEYNGVLISDKFYDSSNKTATIKIDNGLLKNNNFYRADLFFTDGTKAELTTAVDLSIEYWSDYSLLLTTNSTNNKNIENNADKITNIRFIFGENARREYANKTILGFALYQNIGDNNIMATFEEYSYTCKILDVEKLKKEYEAIINNIDTIKTGEGLNVKSITPSKTTFLKAFNMLENGKIYPNSTVNPGTGEIEASNVEDNVIEFEIKGGNNYYFTILSNKGSASAILDANGKRLGSFTMLEGFNWNKEFKFPSNAFKVRVLISADRKDNAFFGELDDFTKWQSGEKFELNGIKIKTEEINKEQLDVFLPKEIYCSVGRVIELYNNQICLQANKYHFQWVCDIGRTMKRKFVINALESLKGNHNLTLNIFNDKLERVWTGTTVVKIVKNTLSKQYNVVALGDSLTAGKWWLWETQEVLSGRKINYVGRIPYTRNVNNTPVTIHCDGRGGFTAKDYNTPKTSDDSIAGGINEGVQAFWNGSKGRFDWNYYVTNVLNSNQPDVLQIFLGTNGIKLNPDENANAIKKLVDYVRDDNQDLPIFIVNTLYRGNQDGIGKQGNNEGYSASGSSFKYEEDKKVFNLCVKLHELLDGYNKLYFIPVAQTFDSEYNFGAIETPVNPRSTIKEFIPKESVHPYPDNATTYGQMADIMFSTFCGILE